MTRFRPHLSLSAAIGVIACLGFAKGSIAEQCGCTQRPPQQSTQQPPPAPPVANGAIVYNPWYPGNVIPFFSAYPFVSTPYIVFDRPVPPPVPAPPPPSQKAAPVVPPDQPYAVAQPYWGYPNQ